MPEYEVGSLYALIGVDNKPFMAGMAQSQAAMDATAKKMSATAAKTQKATDLSMKKVAKGMTRVGASMSKWVTLPVLAAGVASAKFAVDFQKQMEMVRTQAGASQAEVDRMSKAVLRLAASGKVSQGPDELAKGLFHLESVGLRGAQALDALHVAADGAAVGGSNLEDTASALAGVIITGIKGTQDYSKAMGILNATVGAGNMRMQDLVDALKSGIAPVAKTAGMNLRSLAAGLAMMTDEGVPAGTAANRLRTAIFMMTNPTKKAQGVLKDLGLTTTSLGHDLRQPDGLMVAMEDLQKHLQKIQDPTKRLAALGEMFGGSRSAGTIAMLLNNLSRLGMKYDQIGRTAGNFNKDVLKTQETASFKLKAAWSQLQAAMVKVGAVVVPIFASIAQKVASAAAAFSNLSSGVQGTILVIAGVAAAAGPVVFVIGSLIKLYQGLAAAAGFAGRAMGLANAEGVGGAAKLGPIAAMSGETAAAGETAAEGTALGGVSAAGVSATGVMLALAPAVAAVGAAMYLNSHVADVLSGAYQRAQGAVAGLSVSEGHLKDAQNQATVASHQNTAAQHGVEAAQHQVNKLVKDGQKGTLVYKQAVDQLNAAQDTARTASANNALAQANLKRQTAATAREVKASKDAFDRLTEATKKHLQSVKTLNAANQTGDTISRASERQSASNTAVIQNYASKMDTLSQAYTTSAQNLRASNPILAANKAHMAQVAAAAANVARQINAIPTMKQINLDILINTEGNAAIIGGGPHGTAGNPHGGHGGGGGGGGGKQSPTFMRPTSVGATGAAIVANVVANARAAAPSGAAAFDRIIAYIMAKMRKAVGKYGPQTVQEFRNLGRQITDAFDAQTAKMQAALDKQLNGMTAAGKELQALQAAHDEAARQQAITDARSALALAQAQGDPAAILAAQQQLDDALYAEQVATLEKLDAAEQKARAKKVAAEKAALAKQRAELKRHIEKVLAMLNRAEQHHASKKRIKALETLLHKLLNESGGGGGKSGGGGKKAHVATGGGIVLEKGAIEKGAIIAVGKNNRELQDLIAGALLAAAKRNPQVVGGIVT